jgi:hypothetical protein
VPARNTRTAAVHPDAVDSAVLVLNALLGVGTALAPVFVAISDVRTWRGGGASTRSLRSDEVILQEAHRGVPTRLVVLLARNHEQVVAVLGVVSQ